YVEVPLGADTTTGNLLAATLEWAMEHLDQPLPVSLLAAHATLSPRQFTRQFRQATGTTPHQWLLTQRLALAQRLLERTDNSIERIADAAGFGTPAAMRLHFQKTLDTSPAAYRRAFRMSSAA
ncbi:MAG: helix-turn-helix domain-containing protein, partial [Acidimicrobiales bacterium]